MKVQEFLQICTEHIEVAASPFEEKKVANGSTVGLETKSKDLTVKKDAHQTFAVLGIALIAMAESIGSEMALRQFNHLVRRNFGRFPGLLQGTS